MKFISILAALSASSLVAAAPASVAARAPMPVPADGDNITPAVLGYKRSSDDKEDLGYKRDAIPVEAVPAKKDKRHCALPLKNKK